MKPRIPVLPVSMAIVFCLAACGGGGGNGTTDGSGDTVTLPDNGGTDNPWGDIHFPDNPPFDPGTPDPGYEVPVVTDVPDTFDPGLPDIPAKDTGPADPKCQALAAGTVTGFDVDGAPRTFMLHLPAGAENGGPWPVVFNWHGFGDTAANMAWLLSNQVSNATYPFILVTPEDTNLQPPGGMDWDILTIASPNKEARLFDEVLKCVDQKYGVDWAGIHAVGFSAGSIMADLLGVLRGDMMASIATYSGVYFSNPPNVDALGMLSGFVSWPEMTTTNTYVQLLVHGSASDNYNMMVTTLQFDQSGKNDVTWLNGRGHDVIHCDHGLGHTIPSAFNDGGGKLVSFFERHKLGVTTSPWVAGGLPADYPDYCTVKAGQ